MFFRRLPHHSIDNARNLLEHAMDIAQGYHHNKHYVPTEDDMEKFEVFEKEIWQHYCRTRTIVRDMHQRMLENYAEWLDKKLEDKKKRDELYKE